MCSFLGGMRAVTWTQVAQYIILIIAYMIPVVWLSVKQTGIPIPQIVYGKQLQKVTALEEKFIKDPKEMEVRGIFKARADAASAKLKDLPARPMPTSKAAPRERREAEGARTRRPTVSTPPRRRSAAIRRTPPPPRRSGPRTRGLAARAAPPLRHAEAVPGQGRGRARHVARATSSRSCSA